MSVRLPLGKDASPAPAVSKEAPATAAVAEIEPVTEPPLVVMMTESEARDRVDQINNHSNRIGELLLELYERRGWEALRYDSWRECVVAEFEQSQSRLYQLLDAARVERNISNILENGETLPAKAVDQLKHLEPEQQREVVQKAKEDAPDSKITAKQVEESVQKVIEADDVQVPTPRWNRKKNERMATERNAISTLAQTLRERFQTEVTLRPGKKGGQITIKYYNNDDLDRILSLLGVSTN